MPGGLDVASLVVGASLALAGTVLAQSFLQLVVTPRADSLKRREERWERDVIALGELLAHELLPLRHTARRAAYEAARLHAEPTDRRTPTPAATEATSTAQAAADELRAALRIRGTWLLDRVLDTAPTGVDVSDLRAGFAELEYRSRNPLQSALVEAVHREEWPERARERLLAELDAEARLLASVRRLAIEGPRPRRRRLRRRERKGAGG